MEKILIFAVISLGFWMAGAVSARAATLTWDGGGATNNWSEAANWSPDQAPTEFDLLVFDATSSKNSTANLACGLDCLDVLGVRVDAGYSGVLTLGNDLYVGDDGFEMHAATMQQGNSELHFTTGGSFLMTGGTWNGNSGSWIELYGDFSFAGGTWNALTTFTNEGSLNQTIDLQASVTAQDFYVSKDSGATVAFTDDSVLYLKGDFEPETEVNGGTGSRIEIIENGRLRNCSSAGTLPVLMTGSGIQTFWTLATCDFDVTVDKSGGSLRLRSSGGFSGELTIDNASLTNYPGVITFVLSPSGEIVMDGGTWNWNTGILDFRGDFTLNDGAFNTLASTLLVESTGSLTQNGGTIDAGVGTHDFDGQVEFNGGDYDTPASQTTFAGGLIFSGGTITQYGEIIFDGSGETVTVNAPLSFNTLTIFMNDLATLTFDGGEDIVISDSFNPIDGMMEGRLALQGDFDGSAFSFDGGGGTIVVNAADDQYLYGDFTYGPNIEIDKASGTFYIESYPTLVGDFIVTQGDVHAYLGPYIEGECLINDGSVTTEIYFDCEVFTMNGGVFQSGSSWSSVYEGPLTVNGGTYGVGEDGMEIGANLNGNGDLVINGGVFDMQDASWIVIYKDFVKTGGTFDSGTATVHAGNEAAAWSSNEIETFYGFDIWSDTSVDFSEQEWNVEDDLYFDGGEAANGMLNIGGDADVSSWHGGGNIVLAFVGAGDQTFDLSLGGESTLGGDVIIDKPSGSVLLASDLVMDETGQDLDIRSGSLDATAADYRIDLVGNWSNSSTTFYPNQGTVAFVGTSPSTISGSTTFYDLEIAAPGKTVMFEDGSEQTVDGTLLLAGAAGNPVVLRSTDPCEDWFLTAVGSFDISEVDVQDSNALNGDLITFFAGVTDSGNNVNWDFDYPKSNACGEAPGITLPDVEAELSGLRVGSLFGPKDATLVAGKSTTLYWDTKGRAYYVNLYHSEDQGETWKLIAEDVLNVGAYVWDVPVYLPESIRLKVVSTDLVDELDETESADISVEGGKSTQEAMAAIDSIEELEPGDFIRAHAFDQIYLLNGDLARRPLASLEVFYTWADSMDVIRFVTEALLRELPLDRIVLPKVGIVLIKIESVPYYFTTETDEDDQEKTILRKVENTAMLEEAVGRDWQEYVLELPPTLYNHFVIGEPVQSADELDLDISQMKKARDLHE